jgi:hypothetical protein
MTWVPVIEIVRGHPVHRLARPAAHGVVDIGRIRAPAHGGGLEAVLGVIGEGIGAVAGEIAVQIVRHRGRLAAGRDCRVLIEVVDGIGDALRLIGRLEHGKLVRRPALQLARLGVGVGILDPRTAAPPTLFELRRTSRQHARRSLGEGGPESGNCQANTVSVQSRSNFYFNQSWFLPHTDQFRISITHQGTEITSFYQC